jgi:cobalt-zinc-cadmium efflux system outer membrane protein
MRSIKFILTFIFLTNTFYISAQPRELDILIEEAISVSPKLNMLRAKKDASFSRIQQNSNLPDPTLVLGVLNLPTNSFSFDQDPMTQKIVGVRQTFPFPGKLGAIEDASAIDTLIIDQEIRDAENEIRKIVSKKYYELSYLKRSIKLSKESKLLLQDIAKVVSTKYTVGSASQQNLLKVQLEITNITQKIDEVESREQSVLAELNALLFRDENAQINVKYFEDVDFIDLNTARLDSTARIYRPYLKGIRFAENKSELNRYAAEKDYYPNITLGLQYAFREQIATTGLQLDNLLSVVVGVTLPFNYGGKVSAKVEEALSMQQFYSNQYILALQSLKSNFGGAVANLNSLEERIKLFEEGLLPQAKQNLTATLSHYQVGHIDFINVIDAQDQLFKIETNAYRLKTNYLKQISDLEFLVGTSLRNLDLEN